MSLEPDGAIATSPPPWPRPPRPLPSGPLGVSFFSCAANSDMSRFCTARLCEKRMQEQPSAEAPPTVKDGVSTKKDCGPWPASLRPPHLSWTRSAPQSGAAPDQPAKAAPSSAQARAHEWDQFSLRLRPPAGLARYLPARVCRRRVCRYLTRAVRERPRASRHPLSPRRPRAAAAPSHRPRSPQGRQVPSLRPWQHAARGSRDSCSTLGEAAAFAAAASG